MELLENAGLVLFGNAWPRIGHADVEVAVDRLRNHPHLSGVRGLDGVADAKQLKDDGVISIAQACCGLDKRIEYFCTSSAERLMTFKTSAVAVCYSRLSVSSRVRACTCSNSRALFMAIAAWSAKVITSSISLWLKGSSLVRRRSTIPAMSPSLKSRRPKTVRRSSTGSIYV